MSRQVVTRKHRGWLRRSCCLKPGKAGSTRTRRLMLEPLEGRSLLSMTFAVTNMDDSGSGSLRQAILDANSNAGRDSIVFNISGGGVQTIKPQSALPTITDPAVVDGTTQSGYAGSPIISWMGATPAVPTA